MADQDFQALQAHKVDQTLAQVVITTHFMQLSWAQLLTRLPCSVTNSKMTCVRKVLNSTYFSKIEDHSLVNNSKHNKQAVFVADNTDNQEDYELVMHRESRHSWNFL